MIWTRRDFFTWTPAAVLTGGYRADAQDTATFPVVSEDACPLEPFAPVAQDGFRGQGILRKPPGNGPFPAVLWIHGDMVTFPPVAPCLDANIENGFRSLILTRTTQGAGETKVETCGFW